jgi:hypothetical protein
MESWFSELPFSAIIPRSVWDAALSGKPEDGKPDQVDDSPARHHLARSGAWQWRRISSTGPENHAGEDTIVFMVYFSGSLSHLRVFLDSVARQEFQMSRLRPVILCPEKRPDVAAYLLWFGMVHPEVKVTEVDRSVDGWESQLNGILNQIQAATVVLIDDHALLPSKFGSEVQEMKRAQTCTMFFGLPMSLEVSAQIITSNLDPIPHHEKLLLAFGRKQMDGLAEIARILPAQVWLESRDDPAQHIFRKAAEQGDRGAAGQGRTMGLLKLADLP